MLSDDEVTLCDFTNLYDASKRLQGYFLHTWFMHYLNVITRNLRKWYEAGLIGNDGQPTAVFNKAIFDFNALDLEKLSYICAIYFYVLSGHKKSNYFLMKKNAKKRLLYLRGFDFEASVSPGEDSGMGMGLSSQFAQGPSCGRGAYWLIHEPILEYYWEGRHPRESALLFGGKGWIRFTILANGSINQGTGEFKDVCMNEARPPTIKLVDLQRATKEEISIMKDKEENARRALADQKLQAWP